MRTRSKICGITRIEDAQTASLAGVDAIGLVFYEPSPRAVTVATAQALAAALPAFVTLTGLFVNPDRAEVENVLRHVPLDLLQFHGDETPEFCASFGRRWIKAVRVRERREVEEAFEHYSASSGLLVDAYDPERFGGTGQLFDWSLIPDKRPLPLILAGGLNSANVAGAIARVRPWGVDVSGGVESGHGIKDAVKVTEFLSEVNRANQTD